MTRPFGVFQPRDSLTGGVGVCSRVIVTSCCSQMSSHLLLKTLGLSFSPAVPGRGSSLGHSDHLPLRYKLGRAASPNEPQRDFPPPQLSSHIMVSTFSHQRGLLMVWLHLLLFRQFLLGSPPYTQSHTHPFCQFLCLCQCVIEPSVCHICKKKKKKSSIWYGVASPRGVSLPLPPVVCVCIRSLKLLLHAHSSVVSTSPPQQKRGKTVSAL